MLVVCTTDSMIWNFLVPHIKALKEKGIDIECACSRTGFYFDELVNKFGLVLYEIPFERNPFKVSNVKAYFALSNLIKRNNYDYIFGHEPVGGAMARLAGKKNKKYVLYMAHGFHFFSKAPIKHWVLYYTFEYFLSFLTDAIITINQEDFERAKKLHAKHAYKIPGIGVDFSKYEIRNKETYRKKIRKQLDIREDDIVIISVGELSYRKNHEVILDALNLLNNPKIHVMLCGEGELDTYLRNKVKRLGLKNKIHFMGFRKDIPFVLLAADIFIFPSLWEGLGIAGIEAMYSGLPIIGANRQGIRDYVIDGVTGYLFEPNDKIDLSNKIKLLIDNPIKKKEIAEQGKKYVKQFSLENSIEEIMNVYAMEKIINKEK